MHILAFSLGKGFEILNFCQAATYRKASSRRARLAQSVEHQTFKRYGARNLRVAGSNPSSGVAFVSQNTASVQWMSFIRLRLFSRRLRIEAVYVLSYKRSYYSRFSVVNHTLFYLVPRLFCQCKLSFFGLTASRLTSNDTSVPTSYKSLIFYTWVSTCCMWTRLPVMIEMVHDYRCLATAGWQSIVLSSISCQAEIKWSKTC